LGADPGFSNLLASKAVSCLDETREIYTGWDLDSAKPEKIRKQPSAAIVHGIHQLTGKIRQFKDGVFTDTKPVKKKRLAYPGIGTRTVWTIGHPEAVTFPQFFPDLSVSMNVMTTSIANIMAIKLLGVFVNSKLLSIHRAARIAEFLTGPSDPKRTPEKMLERLLSSKNPELPPLFALAVGTFKGRPASVGCAAMSAPPGGMGAVTGVPLAVGISLFHKKKIKKKGIFAPEGVLSPDDFFNELAPHCVPIKKTGSDLILITRSWEKDSFRSRITK